MINHALHGNAMLVRNDTVQSTVTVHARTELIAATSESVGPGYPVTVKLTHFFQ